MDRREQNTEPTTDPTTTVKRIKREKTTCLHDINPDFPQIIMCPIGLLDRPSRLTQHQDESRFATKPAITFAGEQFARKSLEEKGRGTRSDNRRNKKPQKKNLPKK